MEDFLSKEYKQYIVVKLENEQYGIDIKYVDNIVRMQRITRVPKAQGYYKGVINLRGEIIPVLSLRLRFELEPDEYDAKTRILILKADTQYPVGVIVDEVKEVVTLEVDSIEKSTYDPSDDKSRFLYGIGKYNDSLISLLNIPEVIIDKEMEA